MTVMWYLLGAAAGAALLTAVYILRQGSEKFTVLPGRRGRLTGADKTGRLLSFCLILPFVNSGRQDAFILDAFARPLLPEEQFSSGRLTARLERSAARRADGYMEAFILNAGRRGDFILTLEFTPLDGHTVDDMLFDITDVTVDIYYSVLGRTRPKIGKTPLTIPLEEFREGLTK